MEDYRLPGLPRYLRVNTLKIGLGKCKKNLLQTGHHFCPDPKHPGHRAFYRDADVPDLLVFKPKGQSDVSRIPMVASGDVVVQQKASCFPALALMPPPGSHAIDGCAAPGNKTSHLAALMKNEGRVIAFEMNARRCELLREMMAKKGATIVEAKHQSFLDADPNDPIYASVTHILLDPSCSASGMSQTPTTDPKDVQELADGQFELILHAMKFPALEALVYSTCSIYDEENEMVVRRVLRAQQAFGVVPAMPWWHRRGHELPASGQTELAEAGEISRCVVRSEYPDDRTIGFFLARFERRTRESTHVGGAAAADGAGAAGAVDPVLDAKLAALARARTKAMKHEAARQQTALAAAAAMARPSPKASRATASSGANAKGGSSAAGRKRKADAGADDDGDSDDDGDVLGGVSAGGGGGAASKTTSGGVVPQWRLERDAKRAGQKKKKKKRTGGGQ